MEQINKMPIVIILQELTKKEVVVKNGTFIYKDTKTEVENEFLLEASEKQIEYYQKDKIAQINSFFVEEMSVIAAEYPELERLSWDKQEKEARAYQDDNSTATPLIDEIAKARDISKDDLVAKIIEKADAYATASGELIGKRQLLEEQINACTTIDDIAKVEW